MNVKNNKELTACGIFAFSIVQKTIKLGSDYFQTKILKYEYNYPNR